MGYDYDEIDVMKRHGDRPWRRKGMVKSVERVWDDRKRHEYEPINSQRYYEEMDAKGYPAMERQRPEPEYSKRHYDDIDKLQKALAAPKSVEMEHPANSLPPNLPSNINMYGFFFILLNRKHNLSSLICNSFYLFTPCTTILYH